MFVVKKTTTCKPYCEEVPPNRDPAIGLMFAPLSCLCANPFRKAALLFGWAVFLLLAYKVSKLDREYQEYNPYEVLNLDPVNLCFAQSVKILKEQKIRNL